MKQRTLIGLIAASLVAVSCGEARQPVDYVNPYIGNISHILVPTFPTVHLPNSMLRIYPERADYTSEYLKGLPVIVTNHRERSAFSLYPSTSEITASDTLLSYDNEHITPYSYDVVLEDGAIRARYAVSHQSAIYELTSSCPINLALESGNGETGFDAKGAWGIETVSGATKAYVYMQTSPAPSSEQMLDGNRCVMGFDSGKVTVRYGISYISVAQAKANLQREIHDFDIDALETRGRDIWNETLGRIKVKGGTEDQKTVFYTSYYRTFERPVCMSEDGRYWSPFDETVHEDGGVPFYNDDWLWDTYLAAHPLRVIMNRELEENILRSFLLMAEQSGTGWLPTFPEVSGDTRRMNCNHTIASFADAIAKGLDVDTKAACEASYRTLTEKTLAPWSGKPAGDLDRFYWKNGYVAALRPGEEETDPVVDSWEKRQPVAVSLGTAYDCWCMANIAKAAGEDSLAAFFGRNAMNYRILFNPESGGGLQLIFSVDPINFENGVISWGIFSEAARRGLLRSLVFVAAAAVLLGRFAWKHFRYRFSLLTFGVAMAEALLIVERGERMGHANLWWGPFICYWVLLLESFCALLRATAAWFGGERRAWLGARLTVCGTMLVWQIVSGICFLVLLLQGNSYNIPIATWRFWPF